MTHVSITTGLVSSLTGNGAETAQPLSGQQSDASKIYVALYNGNENALEGVDINQYVEVEGQTILLSALLINLFLDPDEENGDDVIRMIMEKQPDLSLMIMPKECEQTGKSFLEELRQEIEKMPIDLEFTATDRAIFLGRIDLALRG